MPTRLDVILLDRGETKATLAEPPDDLPDDVRIHPAPVAADQGLNRVFQLGEGEFLLLWGAAEPLSAAQIKHFVSLLPAHPHAAIWLFARPGAPWSLSHWTWFPPRLASLLASPTRDAEVLFRRESQDVVGAFRNVSDPLWDWLIRMIAAQQEVVAAGEFAPPQERSLPGHQPELVPGRPTAERNWLHDHLAAVELFELAPHLISRADAIALKAGLLQWHDYLDESHELSQSIEGKGQHRSGDYWHAIMHRREEDYSNSKYWLRRVGRHPIFPELASYAAQLLAAGNDPRLEEWRRRLIGGGDWDPFAFVDLCQACRHEQGELCEVARSLQAVEMSRLLRATYRDAAAPDRR